MRNYFLLSLLAGAALVGCTTRKQAHTQAQAAYLAGQRDALLQAQAQAATAAVGPDISVRGQVANAIVPWSDGLTLIQAIAAAGYQGRRDPKSIVVTRRGESLTVGVREVLRGQDLPLEPGDVIEIR